MVSDRKITLHELHAAYARRYAKEHGTTVKATLEDLIEEHLMPDLSDQATAGWGWEELQNAANGLLPLNWHIEPSFNAATAPNAQPRLLHMISLGDVGPVYFTSDDLRRFGKDLISIAALGGVTNMDSEFKIGTSGLQVRRRGNGLMFYEYENLNSEPKATFPNRHVDKLVHSFELAIRSQDEKLKSYYAQ